MSQKLNCAGQECPDREVCRRYTTRTAERSNVEHPVYLWASFDIERKDFGDCPHFIRHQQRQAA